MTATYTGTVKFYHPERGFGFINCDDTDIGEVFFHISGWLERLVPRGDDVYNNQAGDRVVFERVPSRHKEDSFEARNIRRIFEEAVH